MVQEKLQRAMTLHQQGQLGQAQLLYEDVLNSEPEHADCQHLLGLIFIQTKNFQRAADLIAKAIGANPTNPGYFINQGIALKELKQLDAAIESYNHAIALAPNYAAAYYSRGNAQNELRQLDAAVASFDQALALQPNDVLAHINRGMALLELQQIKEALASFDRVIAIQPNYAEAHNNRGKALQKLHQADAAIASYDKAIVLQPDYAEAYYNRGLIQQSRNQLDAAIASYDKAIALKPGYADALFNRGIALLELKKLDAAVASFDKAIALKPDFAEAYSGKGIALGRLGQAGPDVECYRQALHINPKLSDAHHNLAIALQTRGDVQAAAKSYRSALAYAPHRADSHTGLIYSLSNNPDVDGSALFAEQLRFGDQFEAPVRSGWLPHTNAKEPDRCLNVGFVSGDLCNHAVAMFIEPLLQELSRSTQCRLHAYYNHTLQDATSQRLKTYFAHWSAVAGMTDDALAQMIRTDGIDILIDVSGHTLMNRLLTFARKPAPLQVSWLGFPGTTGLKAVDYYLTDRFLTPPGKFDNQFTEKLVHLPALAPFLPSSEAPPVNALPALTNGYMTFGSFNRCAKINPAVIALWAQLLRAQPNSRLVLGGIAATEATVLSALFASEGIPKERLRFFPRSDMKTYLGLHHQVDICLDTFPYNGGTTNLNALWMGVPTLTLSGSTPISHCGGWLSGHMGFKDFQAHTSQEFVAHGVKWASQTADLSQIRANLRSRFVATPLGQPKVIAAGLERALRTMWKGWCTNSSPRSFDTSSF